MTTTAVKERPILFFGPMVRAILEGRKTQTRRIIKPQPKHDQFESCNFAKSKVARDGTSYPSEDERFGICDVDGEWSIECRHGQVGERLWVREAWAEPDTSRPGETHYRANASEADLQWFKDDGIKWKPSIFMPRDRCRITLEITGVRVERLQDISEADAMAEGVQLKGDTAGLFQSHRQAFIWLWHDINGPDSWAANPYVWVIEFAKV